MKKLFMILPLVLVLCSTFACEKEDDDIVAEKAAIQKAVAAWTKASDEKDVDGLVSYLADDSGTYIQGLFQDKASRFQVAIFGEDFDDITYLEDLRWGASFFEGHV